MTTATQEVTHNTAESRFELRVGGELAVAEYVLARDQIIFTHTGVPRSMRGRGIASRLAHAALEHARAAGLRVVPHCSFFRTYIQRHPEYQPLVG
ncbi:MAG: GNAT family N-acetyltransferase [Roseiflexaceae bacterium]